MSIKAHLLGLPVPLAQRATQHFEELMREFQLIAGSDQAAQHVPARLTELVSTITSAYGGINSEADQRLFDAIDRGEQVIDDHVLTVPKAAGPAARALNDLIDEADEYCRQGEHLLTLAFPSDLAAYRRWYLSEILDQLDGKPPVPWPESEHARCL